MADRRRALKFGLGAMLAGGASLAGVSLPNIALAASGGGDPRVDMSPDDVMAALMAGNARFVAGRPHPHDYSAQRLATVDGQKPTAMILSCIDSRAPAELLMDTEIGGIFNARVAGNVSNDDLLGSMEFGCALAGAKLILVLGHTSCGAVKGAIDNAELGHLTGLLGRIRPAVSATRYEGERTSKNLDFVDEVARTNVRMTVDDIRRQSKVLRDLEKKGDIRIRGALYHLSSGKIETIA